MVPEVKTAAPIASVTAAPTATAVAAPTSSVVDPEMPLTWADAYESPQPIAAEARIEPFQKLCGASDTALVDVARRNMRRQLNGTEIFAADELGFTLRAAGDAHVWPRAWSVSGTGIDDAFLETKLKEWVGSWNTLGTRRCGITRGTAADGNTVFSVIAIDALADVTELPTQARVGQWITLEATMLVPASAAKVVLLGPRGAPKAVTMSLSKSKIKSTFSVDAPGQWLVQVLATVSTGPRPVLEGIVFAGQLPPGKFTRVAVPGEAAGAGAATDEEAILQMLNAARAAESVMPLKRDAALDKIAKTHSEDMAKARMIGHDVGTGDPAQRIKAAGAKANVAGENVASAASPENAHRALWASPSHRTNMLSHEFTRVGIAVVRDAQGRLWVTQLYAD